RHCLPAERPGGRGAVDGAERQGAGQQPGRADDPLGADAVPGALSGRGRRQRPADGAAVGRRAGLAGAHAMSALVQLERVTKRYGAQAAVNDLTLEFEAGQCIALVGHNGAGKTTLIKMMLGLTHPTSGRVRVLGEDPLSHAGQLARLSIGYLPENVAFPPSLTGLEMLRFYGRLKRRPRAECEDLLAQVGLTAAAHKRIGTYSKGMRQRLGLAPPPLAAPRLPFLDQPTARPRPFLRPRFSRVAGRPPRP